MAMFDFAENVIGGVLVSTADWPDAVSWVAMLSGLYLVDVIGVEEYQKISLDDLGCADEAVLAEALGYE